jgi:hypothetical protein
MAKTKTLHSCTVLTAIVVAPFAAEAAPTVYVLYPGFSDGREA